MEKKIGRVVMIVGCLLSACLFMVPASGVQAQETNALPSVGMREDFSDHELQSFVKANERVMAIQMEAELNMIKAIENEGLSLDRFNEILDQQRDPQRADETSPEELRSFNNAAQVILTENVKVEQQMTDSIEEEGIDVVTYKEIMVAYQQDPSVQDRVHRIATGEK